MEPDRESSARGRAGSRSVGSILPSGARFLISGQSHRILHHLYGTTSESSGLLTMSRNSLRNLGAFCRARRLVGGPLHFDAGSCTFFCPARNRCPPDGCMGSDVEKCEFAAHRGSSCNPATYLAGGIFRSLPSFDGKLFREVGLR